MTCMLVSTERRRQLAELSPSIDLPTEEGYVGVVNCHYTGMPIFKLTNLGNNFADSHVRSALKFRLFLSGTASKRRVVGKI